MARIAGDAPGQTISIRAAEDEVTQAPTTEVLAVQPLANSGGNEHESQVEDEGAGYSWGDGDGREEQEDHVAIEESWTDESVTAPPQGRGEVPSLSSSRMEQVGRWMERTAGTSGAL